MTTRHQGLWNMDIDEEGKFSHFIPQVKHDLYTAGWNHSLNVSSQESSNLPTRNFYQRKKQVYRGDLYRTEYADQVKAIKDPGYYSSSSSTGSITPPSSPLEESFMELKLKSSPREEICIGLKPSERISRYREILPLQNQQGHIARSKWELMATPKQPLRRPMSPPSYFISK